MVVTPHTYTSDCWCNDPPTHEDDSYGDCTTCREWVHHTEDEYRHVAFPCPTIRLQAAEADADALAEALRHERGVNGITHVGLTALAAHDARRQP